MPKVDFSRSLEILTNLLFGEYLQDDAINEIVYNGDSYIWTEDYKGVWECHKREIVYDSIEAFATTLASYKDDTIKANKPILSASLNSGERVQIAIPFVTKKGKISITIRKPSKVRYTFDDFKKQGMFSNEKFEYDLNMSDNELLIKSYENRDLATFLDVAVKLGKNIVVAGATGSGKTTFMKSLIDFIPLDERIITIEDTEEIVFYEHKNFVQLFYPSEAKEGDPITSATLLKSCLRMKPDRILLAELRGAETYDYLNILTSGHGGSITSIHAGGIEQAFKRLSFMILQNPQGQKIPYEIIMEDLKSVIDIIIHIEAHNGKREFKDVYLKGHYDEKI